MGKSIEEEKKELEEEGEEEEKGRKKKRRETEESYVLTGMETEPRMISPIQGSKEAEKAHCENRS